MGKGKAGRPTEDELRTSVDPMRYAVATVAYGDAERAVLTEMESAIRQRLADKPRRLAHSLSVAKTAEAMAVRYGVSPWEARLAGTLHDWDKVLTVDEQLAKAREQGIDLGVPLERVAALLHGMTAANELAELHPSLPGSVLQAISRHTIGAASMTALDKVIFVADVIEPRRPAVAAVEAERAMVAAGKPLDDVYWSAFSRGIIYVIETGRYLYPGTIDIYNELVGAYGGRRRKKG